MRESWDEPPSDPMMVAFTPLRRVTARESPYAGTLVRGITGVHVLVDPDEVPAFDLFWTPRDDAHVLRAADVVHAGAPAPQVAPAALVEACREPLEVYVAARADGGAPLSEPECATVMLSILRGARELRTAGLAHAAGAWWLSSTARPVFALGASHEDAVTSGRRVLRRLPLGASEGLVVRDAIDAILRADETRSGTADACERAVFEWTQPAPLHSLSGGDSRPFTAPARARGDAGDRALREGTPVEAGEAASPGETGHPGQTAEPGAIGGLLRAADSGWHEVVAALVSSARRSWRAGRPLAGERARDRPRRGRLIAGAAVAGVAVALAATVILPGGDGDETRAPASAVSPSSSAVEASGASPESAAAEGAASADIVTAAGDLLDGLATCGGAPECVQTVAEGPGVALPGGGAASAPRGSRALELVDEYGDVAVVRASAEGAGSQLVVLVRHDERWLLREIMDLTQQPPS